MQNWQQNKKLHVYIYIYMFPIYKNHLQLAPNNTTTAQLQKKLDLDLYSLSGIQIESKSSHVSTNNAKGMRTSDWKLVPIVPISISGQSYQTSWCIPACPLSIPTIPNEEQVKKCIQPLKVTIIISMQRSTSSQVPPTRTEQILQACLLIAIQKSARLQLILNPNPIVHTGHCKRKKQRITFVGWWNSKLLIFEHAKQSLQKLKTLAKTCLWSNRANSQACQIKETCANICWLNKPKTYSVTAAQAQQHNSYPLREASFQSNCSPKSHVFLIENNFLQVYIAEKKVILKITWKINFFLLFFKCYFSK